MSRVIETWREGYLERERERVTGKQRSRKAVVLAY